MKIKLNPTWLTTLIVIMSALLIMLSGCPSTSYSTTTTAPTTTTTSPIPSSSPSQTASPLPSTPSSTTSASPSATSTGTATTINLTAQNIAFNMSTITVKAGAQVTVNFNNMDNGIPHNFAVYTDSSATKSIFVGQIVNGPGTMKYTFTAPTTPGNYFFRCDVHPTQMTGQFIVQ